MQWIRRSRIDASSLANIHYIPKANMEGYADLKKEGNIDILQGELNGVTDEGLDNFKKYAMLLEDLQLFDYGGWSTRIARPNCSVKFVLRGAVLGTEEKIATLKPW